VPVAKWEEVLCLAPDVEAGSDISKLVARELAIHVVGFVLSQNPLLLLCLLLWSAIQADIVSCILQQLFYPVFFLFFFLFFS